MWGWDVAWWHSACLACVRPWVGSQHQKRKDKKKYNTFIGKITRQNPTEQWTLHKKNRNIKQVMLRREY
jgi:hypothetical protein